MNRSLPERVTARVPAKINLGLAVTGRRPDGYHDLLTIMQTIDLVDELTVRRLAPGSGETDVAIRHVRSEVIDLPGSDPDLRSDDNLAARALRASFRELGVGGRFDLAIEKGIPVASGLGGASSDAAAAVLIAEEFAGRSLDEPARVTVAAGLGSDVPFALQGGTALVSGRGETVTILPGIPETSLIVMHPIGMPPIPRKTATLYAALTVEDMTLGEDVLAQADLIQRGEPLDPDLLDNAFSRVIVGLLPELVPLIDVVERVTGRRCALSGAGPAHYLVEPDPERARASVTALRRELGQRAGVYPCRPWPGPAEVVAVG